jgi:uncharacterized protein with NRDE domain
MCVAAIAWNAHPRWRLIAIGNRDEYQQRPSAPLAAWDDGSGIIAGKDLQAGGTWLGVTASGRFALVTNFRVEGYPRPGFASRGGLVKGWLKGEDLPDVSAMNPFNICLADRDAAHVLTNHPEREMHPLAPGIHGLSNGAFARPWPKTRQLCADLKDWLSDDAEDFAPLLAALRSEDLHAPKSPDEEGPEAPYSPVFINDPVYGTRCSTVVAIGQDGGGVIVERSFDARGEPSGDVAVKFGAPASG